MAILKGFPPSNTISIDRPSPWICQMCGKEFMQSFPLGLGLTIKDECNYSILPCRECWSEDQGTEYWGCKLNKWGEHDHIYSKVRNRYSKEEIEKAYSEHHNYDNKDRKWTKTDEVRFDRLQWHMQTKPWCFKTFYDAIVSKITDSWSQLRWRTNYKEDTPPTPKQLLCIGNQRMCDMFVGQEGFKKHFDPKYFGMFSDQDWTWYVQMNPDMPDKMDAVFMREIESEIAICGNP